MFKHLQLKIASEGECLGKPCVPYKDAWNDLWFELTGIISKVVDYGDIWKEEHKSQKKKWALSEFLNLLKNSGLAKHTPVHIKVYISSLYFVISCPES